MTEHTMLRLGESESGPLKVNLEELLETRCLVTATSGGGKSGAIYQLCEQCVGHVPIFLMDPEGEFAPLRSKFPFVLAGPDGDTPATVKTAALLAHRLLKVGVSAICDLYELPPHQRQEFVDVFLRAMIDAPKALWRPVIVVVDEAHVFAPEKGQGDSVALESVVDMASRGRKRGFCLVVATQRLAMLSKTVAANCQNVLVGRTSQIDQARAAETLHISGKAAKEEFWKIISRTKTGEFFAHGRAFGTDVPTRFQVDKAATLPEKKDRLTLAAPPAPKAIQALLPSFADLPQEADRRTKSEEDLQAEIKRLQQQVEELTAAGGGIGKEREMGLLDEIRALEQRANDADARVAAADQENVQMRETFVRLGELMDEMQQLLGRPLSERPASPFPARALPASMVTPAAPRDLPVRGDPPVADVPVTGKKLSGNALKMAQIAAGYGRQGIGIEKKLLAVLCGTTLGGGFSARLSEARSAGAIRTEGTTVFATSEGVAIYGGTFKAPSTTAEVVALWRPRLSGTALKIFEYLVSIGGASVTRAELAKEVGTSLGGGFSARLSEVRSTGLLSEQGGSVAVDRRLLFIRTR